jgi:hypothetical protein
MCLTCEGRIVSMDMDMDMDLIYCSLDAAWMLRCLHVALSTRKAEAEAWLGQVRIGSNRIPANLLIAVAMLITDLLTTPTSRGPSSVSLFFTVQ